MDNNMCPLCLRHRADQESHGKDIEKKPMCHDSECKEQPTESPHDPMTRGPVTMNEMEGEEDKEDEQGYVNVVMCEGNEEDSYGWRTIENSWLELKMEQASVDHVNSGGHLY